MENAYVKASEISEFVYCKRAWWMRFNGQLEISEQMEHGIKKHDAVSEQLRTFKRRYVVAALTIVAGILLFALYYLLQVLI